MFHHYVPICQQSFCSNIRACYCIMLSVCHFCILQPLRAYSEYCIIHHLSALAMTKRSVASESNKLHFQVQVPDSFGTLGSTSSRPSSSTTTPNRVPMSLNITLTSEDNVDMLSVPSVLTYRVHWHMATSSTSQLVQNQRHIKFWEPLTNFAVNEPIQVIITQLAIRSPSEIFLANSEVVDDVNMHP